MLQPELRTEVGRRSDNEDALFASHRLAVVADGVGGSAAGEVASQAVVDALVHLDKCRLEGRLEDALAKSVAWGNETIGFVASCRPELAGMSTTLTALALADDGDYALVNIGDSRAYLLRDGMLTRLTRDDSLVQQLLDGGHLSEEQARRHPQRSIVTEALDGRARAPAAVTRLPARAGDRLLLCSDGLSDVVDDETIAAVLAEEPAAACADHLVELALAAGGRDNVSVIVADVVPKREDAPGWA